MRLGIFRGGVHGGSLVEIHRPLHSFSALRLTSQHRLSVILYPRSYTITQVTYEERPQVSALKSGSANNTQMGFLGNGTLLGYPSCHYAMLQFMLH